MKRLALLVIALAVATAGGWLLYRDVREPYRGYTGAERFVDIPPGTSTKVIGDRLIAAGVVRDPISYRLALWMSGHARDLKAGEYRFAQAMTPVAVIGKIARGESYVVNLTFPEGLSIADMARTFESHGFGAAAGFMDAAKDGSLIRTLDPKARDLEGYLFPDTYPLPRRADATRLVRVMVDRFEKVLTPELREAAKARGLTVRQLVTLASIVEKETGRAEERPVIAAVYENRLRAGIPLQCDPTVIYALEREGKYTGNLRRTDLEFNSPYNTYRYPGLPPGPIASPSKASLESTLRPAAVDYVYFVSRNDGTHEFARTLAEHNRNVQKYQVQYFREQRAHRSPHFSFSRSTEK
jgi:UPF0755 protein